MLVDYHCHLAPDDEQLGPAFMTDEWIAVYAAAAHARGVGELALTEHCHRFRQAAGISAPRVLERNRARRPRRVLGALAAAATAGQPIRVGIELDWLGDDAADDLRALIADRDLDIVLGSVHWLAGAMIDHPDYPVWGSYSVEDVWRLYFEALRRAAMSGLYDVMAHPDLPKVFGDRPPGGVPQREYEEPPTLSRRPALPARSRPQACASRWASCIRPRRSCRRAPIAASRSRSPRTVTARRTSGSISSMPRTSQRRPATAP